MIVDRVLMGAAKLSNFGTIAGFHNLIFQDSVLICSIHALHRTLALVVVIE